MVSPCLSVRVRSRELYSYPVSYELSIGRKRSHLNLHVWVRAHAKIPFESICQYYLMFQPNPLENSLLKMIIGYVHVEACPMLYRRLHFLQILFRQGRNKLNNSKSDEQFLVRNQNIYDSVIYHCYYLLGQLVSHNLGANLKFKSGNVLFSVLLSVTFPRWKWAGQVGPQVETGFARKACMGVP